jgi:hypothetical protein
MQKKDALWRYILDIRFAQRQKRWTNVLASLRGPILTRDCTMGFVQEVRNERGMLLLVRPW